MKSSQALMRPIASSFINDHVQSQGRAVALSAASMAYALFRLPLKPLSGVVADLSTPILAVAALGGFFLLSAVVLYVVEAPVGKPRERTAPASD